MFISEIFHSIQGEGVNAGKPAVFVRLGSCNLRCRWCDTKYAWSNSKNMSLPAVFKKIKQFKNCKHLVITGGEPLLQQDAVLAICRRFLDYYIEIETNGSLAPRRELIRAADLFTVSYKTKNADCRLYKLRKFGRNVVYKFVVDSTMDFVEIEQIREKHKLPADKIYLMPQGQSRAEILKRGPFIIEYCKKRGYCFTGRLQILHSFK